MTPGRSIYGGTWPNASVTGQEHRRRVAVRAAVNARLLTPALSGAAYCADMGVFRMPQVHGCPAAAPAVVSR